MGFEGANVLFDTWVHPLVMGLEEHLLGMFRDDFEFSDANGPSHHGHAPSRTTQEPETALAAAPVQDAANTLMDSPADMPTGWTAEAEKELKKIPFFVRGKARRNTETFAAEHGLAQITLETLYDAKAHFGR